MQVRKQQLDPDIEQLVPNWERSKINAVYCHPAYLIYMQSTSCKMLGWTKHKLESRLPGLAQAGFKIVFCITSHMQMTPPLGQEVKRN